MTTIRLPYPPAVLNPNSRVHWTKRAKAAKKYKADCYLAMLAFGNHLGRLGLSVSNAPHFSLTFCPPDSRRRDLDNQLASVKQALDALSERCGVDDSKFQLTISKGEPVKGGCVIVEVLG